MRNLNLKTNLRKKSTKSGFTLLETLVAIAIVLVAISTSFTIIPQGQSAIRHIRNQITATYLAQEAIEVVRNHRDKYMIHNADAGYIADWKAKLVAGPPTYNDCITEVGDPFVEQCMINSYEGTRAGENGENINAQFIKCTPDDDFNDLHDTNCEKLQYIVPDNEEVKIYGNDFTGANDDPQDTIYTRWVEIVAVPNEMAGRWEADATASTDPANPDIVKNDVEMQVTAHVIWQDKGNQKSFTLKENLFYYQRPSDHGVNP